MLHFELHLNLWFKWASTNLVASCISPNTSICTCHVHASFCCICLCVDRRRRFFSIGSTPEGVPKYLSEEQCPFVVYQESNPLEHFDKSHSLAPTPFTALGQQRSNCYFFCCGSWTHSSAWPVIATVNSWNPLAWVGVAWALMCLLIHACFLYAGYA